LDASVQIERAISLAPSQTCILLQAVEIATKREEFSAAIDFCRRAVESDPSNPWSLYQLADLLMRRNDLMEAYEVSVHAVSLRPEQSQLLLRASEVAARCGMRQKSIEWAEKAVAADDENPWSSYHLAGLHLACGNLDEAAEAARKAFELSPNQSHFLIRVSEVEVASNAPRRNATEQAKKIFSLYHSNRDWGSTESFSGRGSELATTEVVRAELEMWLSQNPCVEIFFDAPCGDFHWMRHLVWPRSIRYIGADIVERLIDHNIQYYAAASRDFLVLDIVDDQLPKADAWLCRDALIHFPFDIGREVTLKFRSSKIRYFISTTFPSEQNLEDCVIGGYHKVNLSIAPFCLGKPQVLLRDPAEGNQTDRFLGVWENDSTLM
jgi:tetratricopeptide (TPR) repeat protein